MVTRVDPDIPISSAGTCPCNPPPAARLRACRLHRVSGIVEQGGKEHRDVLGRDLIGPLEVPNEENKDEENR